VNPAALPPVSTSSATISVHRVVPRMLQACPVSTDPHPIEVAAMSNGAITTGSPRASPIASAASARSSPVRDP
jgi:hypothetical protein